MAHRACTFYRPERGWRAHGVGASARPGALARQHGRGPPGRSWCAGPGAARTCGAPGAGPSSGPSVPGIKTHGVGYRPSDPEVCSLCTEPVVPTLSASLGIWSTQRAGCLLSPSLTKNASFIKSNPRTACIILALWSSKMSSFVQSIEYRYFANSPVLVNPVNGKIFLFHKMLPKSVYGYVPSRSISGSWNFPWR